MRTFFGQCLLMWLVLAAGSFWSIRVAASMVYQAVDDTTNLLMPPSAATSVDADADAAAAPVNRFRRYSTTTTPTTTTTAAPGIGAKSAVLDQYSHRYPDGSYEFRYELSDGTARYERGYFVLIDKIKSLVVVGYYSYRMPDGRYITVFYNADRHGYRQNQSITREVFPNLPRSIEVPETNMMPLLSNRDAFGSDGRVV